MCGIAGIYRWDDPAPQDRAVRSMTARLAHRGPDGEGIHAEPGLAIGHRRLSIIDLSERGRQPMSNEDGTVWLTFNGEIYNYRELRPRLESRGHRFASDADSEVLVHQYEECADSLDRFLEPVRGMFAFAIWDRPRQRLLLARDRLGIKPLVYHLGAGFLAFASDLDGLTSCADVPRHVDWTSVYEYLLLLTIPGPHTILRDVKCLPAGSMLSVERGGVREVPYWRLDPAPTEPMGDEREADEALEAILSESVDLHLVADVEVGTFLSGGIDSGLVTALAVERHGGPVRTFSATFPGEAVDEGAWARQAAQDLATVHTEFAVTVGFLDGIEQVVGAMDQPMALTSGVSLYHLSRLARESIKVVLTGDGSDEIFAGYTRHRPLPSPGRRVEWIPLGARPAVGRLGRALLPVWARKRWRRLDRAYALSAALARDEAEEYASRLYHLEPAEALSLLPRDTVREVDTDRYPGRLRDLFARTRHADPLSRMLFVDLQTSLADEMLSKVDRMTMAWGLEARVPFLDHRLVELAMRIPGPAKRNGTEGKLPLRRLAAKRLGRDTAKRAKHGFESPLGSWLRDDPATRSTLARLWPLVEGVGLLDRGALAAFRERLPAPDGPTALSVFALLVLGLWAERTKVGIAGGAGH